MGKIKGSDDMNENQTFGKMTVLGVQHVFAMFGSTILVPLLTGLDPAVALFCAGIGTLIFHFITGRKVPVFLGSSFAFISAIIAVASMMSNNAEMGTPEYLIGLRYACGGIICAGGIYIILAILVKIFGPDKIRSFFPPLINGIMIVIIGLMLAPTAIDNIMKVNGEMITGPALWCNWLIALVTIMTMLVISVFAKGFYRMVPILFGIAVGYVVTVIFHYCGLPVQLNLDPIIQANWFQVPQFFTPLFDIRAIMIIAPLAIVTFVEHLGDITANSAVVGKDFFQDPGLHRTLLGDGIATMVAGLIGGPANTTYSENTGVLAATKNYNPVTLEIAAVFAILISFIGKFSGFLQTLPAPVMGGISIILFGMIASVGLRILVEGQVDFKDSRNMIIAAIMLVLGLGGAVFQISEYVSITGVALSAIVGIILNKLVPEQIEKETE